MPGMPCNATELVHFRKRIGVKGFNLIFKMSVALHGKQAQESSVLIGYCWFYCYKSICCVVFKG
jgi:IS5 family transposase